MFKARIRSRIAVGAMSALAFTFGLQVVALAAPAQSGEDVGTNCYIDYGPSGQFQACATGGCKALHSPSDTDGFNACMAKANEMLQFYNDLFDVP